MFKDKRVIVTGGAGALGQAVVEYYETRGARVAIVDYNEEILDGAFPQRSATNLYISGDLTDRASCQAAVASVVDAFGGVDILCNIAGGFMMGEPVHETSDKTWDFLFNLNTRSVMNMASAVVPQMLSQKGGKIVNIAARAATAGAANMGTYTASKAAVMRLTESMALELREHNINVNCILPGTIDTPRNRQDMPRSDHSKWVPTPDIARVIGFLTSDDAIAVHGAGVPVDGLS
ncbi:MAG: SDR family NAD(P)-dependent oxidoreductase [Proteobacteria bacterium]|nr:SDR family NAD(P)-dependent oxidoreductase [Pseudomonadota bacterium]MDA1299791.1 SDR family NAD(P)-dependent oxidoreductase [Pseudomonadota bacterium]